VRELKNVIERAVILCEGGLIDSEHLPLSIVESDAAEPARVSPMDGAPPPPQTLGAAERDLIVQALAKSGNNKSKAARLLGLTRAQLRSRLEKHGIAVAD
jgi:DNA-binding NtrC family response regulator